MTRIAFAAPLMTILGYAALVACSGSASVPGAGDATSLDWVGADSDAAPLPDVPHEARACESVDAGLEVGPCQVIAWDPLTCEARVEELPEGGACDDDDPCTWEDRCEGGQCAGRVIEGACDDQNPCTADGCVPGEGCRWTPTTETCDDGNPCSTQDRCNQGVCLGGPPAEACGTCDDGADTCELSWGDGDPCNGTLVCAAGACVVAPDSLPRCPFVPSAGCLVAGCDPATGGCGLVARPEGVACADGDPCTVDEVCDAAGGCAGVPDEGAAACACVSDTDCAALDDGDACTGALVCVGGRCRVNPASLPEPCAPGEPLLCKARACNPATGACVLKTLVDGTPCDDGDPCTVGDACESGSCVAGAPRSCAALVTTCRVGACDADTGLCQVEPRNQGQVCTNADKCALDARCDQGACVTAIAKNCDDDERCTADTCDPLTGSCVFTPTPLDVPEPCNGFDDDCDGLADPQDPDVAVDDPQLCESQFGVCKGATKPSDHCTGASWKPCTVDAYVTHDPAYEHLAEATCDGKDNDCNGATDEQLGQVQTTCGLGACLVLATGICVKGVVIADCTPKPPLAATDESCNGVDDDCDGATDEDFPLTVTTCGTGACQGQGVRSCQGGGVHDTCQPVAPVDEVCNGQDDDCDGQTDDPDPLGQPLCPAGMSCQWAQCLPEDMRLVPAGDYWRGCNASLNPSCQSDEKPPSLVYLDAYLLDRTEVPASRYQACVDAGSCTAPIDDADYDPANKPNHPATGVNWYQAGAYCAWMGRRLPTEAEWEKGARGGCELLANCATQSRIYPWGNDAPTCTLAHYVDCTSTAGTRPVGSLSAGASPYDLLDMAGNAAEWVADWYSFLYDAEDVINPNGPGDMTYRVIRGGNTSSRNGSASDIRVSARFGIVPPHGTWSGVLDGPLGFRCALSLADL